MSAPATTACPTCYRRLPKPGTAAHGHPITVPSPPDVTAVSCRVDDERITVEFASGLIASRPIAVSRRLQTATPGQRAAVLITDGHILRWEEIDEDIDAAQFLGIPEDLGAASLGADIAPYRRRPS